MATPHIVLFADINCSGDHRHIFQKTASLPDFNDVTSSFVILEGNWQFFYNDDFGGQMGPDHGVTLGPGIYDWIEASTALGTGTNDQLSALQPV